MSKAATPEKSLTVVYTYIGENGASGSANVTVNFFVPIMDPEVSGVAIASAVSSATLVTELSLSQNDLLTMLFPSATMLELGVWKANAKDFTLTIQPELSDADAGNPAKFYLSSVDKGTNVADAEAFDEIKISLVNKTAAGSYYATLSYQDQAENVTEVKIGFTVNTPVETVEGPTGKEIADNGTTVEVALADFTAKDASPAQVSNSIAKIVSAVSADSEKMTVEVQSEGAKIGCTRVCDTPAEAGSVEVTAMVEDAWGVSHEVTFAVSIAAVSI